MFKDKNGQVIIPPFRELFAKEIADSDKTMQYFFENFKSSCPNSYEEAPTGWRYMDCGSWDEFSECSAPVYYAMARECVKRGITHVYDVGCCTAWQARIFNAVGIEYTGIEVSPHDAKLSPKEKGIKFVNKAYPFPIEVKDRQHTAVISNLCVGYDLLEGNPERKSDFTHRIYEQIVKDFDYFIGNVGPSEFDYFKSRFGTLSHDENGHCTCWGNRDRFKEFDNKSLEAVMKDMSIFTDFRDIMIMVAEDKKKEATKIGSLKIKEEHSKENEMSLA